MWVCPVPFSASVDLGCYSGIRWWPRHQPGDRAAGRLSAAPIGISGPGQDLPSGPPRLLRRPLTTQVDVRRGCVPRHPCWRCECAKGTPPCWLRLASARCFGYRFFAACRSVGVQVARKLDGWPGAQRHWQPFLNGPGAHWHASGSAHGRQKSKAAPLNPTHWTMPLHDCGGGSAYTLWHRML
jgi:hypothetical protein